LRPEAKQREEPSARFPGCKLRVSERNLGIQELEPSQVHVDGRTCSGLETCVSKLGELLGRLAVLPRNLEQPASGRRSDGAIAGGQRLHDHRDPRGNPDQPLDHFVDLGIAVDVSASGLFVQTNAKPMPGAMVELKVSLPGVDEPAVMEARVARKKVVPVELLTLAQGGVGLSLRQPADAYLDFVADISPEHAEAVAKIRARKGAGSVGGGGNGKGARSGSGANGAAAANRFRIHAVEIATGKKNSFLVSCASEQEAGEEVLKQLGNDWQVLFIERA
jgi:hypothetical protein